MKSGWRFVGVIVLIALLLGALCVGVGTMTGADYARIWNTLDARFHVDMYYRYIQEVINILVTELSM